MCRLFGHVLMLGHWVIGAPRSAWGRRKAENFHFITVSLWQYHAYCTGYFWNVLMLGCCVIRRRGQCGADAKPKFFIFPPLHYYNTMHIVQNILGMFWCLVAVHLGAKVSAVWRRRKAEIFYFHTLALLQYCTGYFGNVLMLGYCVMRPQGQHGANAKPKFFILSPLH